MPGGTPIVWATDLSPVVAFITPFLARKGAGGMVERAVGHRRHSSGAGVSRQSRSAKRGEGRRKPLGKPALGPRPVC